MEAEGRDPGGEAEDAQGQGGPSDPGSSGGPEGQEGPGRGGTEEAGADAELLPQVSRALVFPWRDRDALADLGGHAGSTTRRSGRHWLQFYLTVPFPSPMEAEMACQFLTPYVQTLEEAGVKELTVSGNLLTVQLTAQDLFEIRNCIAAVLDHLSLLVLPPCFYIEPTMEKGG